MLVDQQTLADFFDVSPRTIRNWQSEGMPVEGDRNSRQYDTAECVAWAAGHKLAPRSDSSAPEDLENLPTEEEADRRWKTARARLKELEFARERDEIITREVFEDAVGDLLDTLYHELRQLPGRWGAQMVGFDEPREAEGQLQKMVREILERLSGSVADEMDPEVAT